MHVAEWIQMNRLEKALAVVAFTLWSAMLVGVGYAGHMLLDPAEARIVQVRGGNTLPLLDEAWGYVRAHFIGTVPSNTLRNYGAIRGALATLNDPYTTFIEPQPRAIERDHMRGQFGGIGVSFRQNEQGEFILTPNPDGPAAKMGVREGDILFSVDGYVLPPAADFEVVARIRGPVGTPVTIEVLRGPSRQRLSFTVVRQLIEINSVTWRMITSTVDGRPFLIGYLKISTFTERSGAEVQRAVARLTEAGAQAYLIDLRDNGGGALSAAVEASSVFLQDGVVAFEVRRSHPGIEHRVRSVPVRVSEHQPIVVLVNGNTASAAEIMAAALRDHRRGQLVGSKTFGKGSVQLIFELSDGSAVRVTAAKWLTPARHALDGAGLVPDVEVDGSPAEQEAQAVEVLRLAATKRAAMSR